MIMQPVFSVAVMQALQRVFVCNRWFYIHDCRTKETKRGQNDSQQGGRGQEDSGGQHIIKYKLCQKCNSTVFTTNKEYQDQHQVMTQLSKD